jgi:hypothetical protein
MRDEEIDLDRVRERVKAQLKLDARQTAQETLEDRVRERVKARLQRRPSSPRIIRLIVIGILAVVVISILTAVGGSAIMAARSTAFAGMPSALRNIPSGIWAIVSLFVLMTIVRRFRGGLRSSRWRSMPRDEEIDRAIRRELRREQRRMGGPAAPYWSESVAPEDDYADDECCDDDEYADDYGDEKPKRGELQPSEKRKNEPVVQLGDDGELIFDDEPQHRVSRDRR